MEGAGSVLLNLLDKGFAVILESITKLSNQISKYIRLTCLHQGDFSNEDAQVTGLTSGLDTSHLQITRNPPQHLHPFPLFTKYRSSAERTGGGGGNLSFP